MDFRGELVRTADPTEVGLLHVGGMMYRLTLAVVLCVPFASARGADVVIDTAFPGGNALVQGQAGDRIELAPDLRGGKPWFYWCFSAEAARPGPVTFVFRGPPKIGVRGPAVSEDEGRTWRWLGAEQVEYEADGEERFSYAFAKAKQRVRFAVAIPYLQQDLDAFVERNAGNPHLTTSQLTKTRNGTPVDLLHIGRPGPGVRAMLVTARHHACESMASYVLEGFLQEALSNSRAGIEFRERYVLFAVPLVDKDGVQAGDQGKNRAPHDHNRDYGAEPIYPEIRAIQELVEGHDVRQSIDFHCPALRGDIHEAMHFLGLGVPHVKENLNEWIAWIREERPQEVMVPLDFLVDPQKPNAVNRRINSHYLATREKAVFAATLEVPYTQPNTALDPAMARAYGAGLLRAWVRTTFQTAAPDSSRGEAGHAHLQNFRAEFLKLYRGQPQEAESRANAYRNSDAPAVLRVEATNLLATLRLHQKQFAEAKSLSEAVLQDDQATMQQRATATQQQLQAVCSDPQATAQDVEASFARALQFPYPALEQQAKVFELVSEFYRRQGDMVRAIELTRKQMPVARGYERGKLWNRIATDYEALSKPDEALGARRQAVAVLRPQLTPVPVSVFGAMMTVDLFDALHAIPDTPLVELKAAAQLVFDHQVVSAANKDRVRGMLAARGNE